MTSSPIALFTGSADSFNVRRTVEAIGELLVESFDLALISTTDPTESMRQSFAEIHGTSHAPSLRGETRALDSYLSARNPACVMNVSRPPIHGNVVGLLARRHGVRFVYRYSGDRFHVHRLADSHRQWAKWYGLNNIVGSLPLRLATRYVALGPVGKGRLLDRDVPDERCVVLPPPVRPDGFSPSGPTADLDVPADRHVVLFVGRRSRLKGIETLEAAIPSILDGRDDLQFVFVGGGRTINVPSSVTDHVTVVGRVPPTSVPEYFRRADVLVHPSLTESFGRVLVEAQLCGTPVIAREAGEMPSITSNLFRTYEELVDLVVEFEAVPVEDASRFTPGQLRPSYVEFFEQF